MNKILSLLLFVFVAMISVGFVSAWHCADTDAKQPPLVKGVYGPWGDNGFLGGNTTGWLSNTNVPTGCTGVQGSIKCQDYCDGTSLVEFYCNDRAPTNESYQDCHKVGSRNVCVTKWHMVSHNGETVISWLPHEDSAECGHDVPEFGVVAGALALIGALGIIAFRRK